MCDIFATGEGGVALTPLTQHPQNSHLKDEYCASDTLTLTHSPKTYKKLNPKMNIVHQTR